MDIEQRALELVNEVAAECGESPWTLKRAKDIMDASFPALCRAIEAHDAYRQEVSDAVVKFKGCADSFLVPQTLKDAVEALSRFIIQPKTDPLVEVIAEAFGRESGQGEADSIRAALKSRGLEIREVGE